MSVNFAAITLQSVPTLCLTSSVIADTGKNHFLHGPALQEGNLMRAQARTWIMDCYSGETDEFARENRL